MNGFHSLAMAAFVSLVLLVGSAGGADDHSPPLSAAAASFEVPPVEVEGPFRATIRLEANERVRGELVDWFETHPTLRTATTTTGSLEAASSSACA